VALVIELEFRNVDFCGGRKTREKPSKQGRESTTNPIPGIEPKITLVKGEHLANTPHMQVQMNMNV
jgi:hypothetical protein